MKAIKHVVISNKYNIGDVIVTLPLAKLIKDAYPDCKITFLTRDYVKDIISIATDVDQFASYNQIMSSSDKEAVEKLKALKADVLLHIIPDKRLAKLAGLAKIPMRIGTIKRWYHFLHCNRIVMASRRSPRLHEGQINLRYLSGLHLPYHYTADELSSYIRFTPKHTCPEKWLAQLNEHKFNIILHPGSNGNGIEWPIAHFQALIAKLPHEYFQIFISGSEKEAERFSDLLIKPFSHVINLMGQLTLEQFAHFIQRADAFIGNSTGPLHLSAGIGTRTLGLYPMQKGMNPVRWKPLGRKSNCVVSEKICDHCLSSKEERPHQNPACTCMSYLKVETVLQQILSWIRFHPTLRNQQLPSLSVSRSC